MASLAGVAPRAHAAIRRSVHCGIGRIEPMDPLIRLSYGAHGPAVVDLQDHLDRAGGTRLPRLVGLGVFDALTMARVMEFQKQEGLATDGAVGPLTVKRLAKKAGKTSPAPLGRCIVVDLINEHLMVYENGRMAFGVRPIKGGAPTDPSTRGVFKVYKRLRHHTSSKYPYPPGNMDFALFFHGAEAIHQGPPTIPSHGCIHVAPSEAERIFNWARNFDIEVVVLKRTR
jgi:L,D-transpeptidase catalytic domain/Putative peptidoglycan binding domain